MGWTKRQFVVAAFEEIGLADYVYDLSPEQLQSALRRLDAMMATWNAINARVGYPLPADPQDSSLDEQTNIPDYCNETVFQNLAIRIAPGYGKQVSPDTKTAARAGYLNMVQQAIGAPPEMQMPGTMPKGAGNKPWRTNNQPFLNKPVDPISVGEDGDLDLGS